MRKLVAMLLAVLTCLSLGIISSCGKGKGVSKTEWETAFSASNFENYTIDQTNEVVYEGQTMKQTTKMKFVENGCLASNKIDGNNGEYVQYYGTEEANLQKGYYNKIYSAISENYDKFTYDKSVKNYQTTTDITVNVTVKQGEATVSQSLIMKNTKVAIDESGKVTNVEFDYSMSVAEQSGSVMSSGKMTLNISNYGTTVITDAEKASATNNANS